MTTPATIQVQQDETMTNSIPSNQPTGDQRAEFDGSTIARAIPPAPDKATGSCPPMERWPSPVQADQSNPAWSHSGRGGRS